MTTEVKSNRIFKGGISWEVRSEGNDIYLDSPATDQMRVIHNGYEDLMKEIEDNLPAAQRHKTSVQKIAEFAEQDLAQYAWDNYDMSQPVEN